MAAEAVDVDLVYIKHYIILTFGLNITGFAFIRTVVLDLTVWE